MEDLDDILNGAEATQEPQAAEPVAEPEQPKADTARDEKGRFAPKGDEQAEPVAAPPAVEEKTVPTKALQEERRKRQELEARLAEIEARANQQPQQPAPSVWEDEQGAFQHFGGQVVQTAVQQASLNAKLDMSEMMVRQANPDFEEVKAEFLAMAEQNPAIVQQALSDPHPWNRAYQIAKNARTMKELGATDLDTLKAKLTEQIKAEMAAQQPAPQAQETAIPTSLADAQSARLTATAPQGPPTLDDILGRKA